jgi:hypothetical protein
LIGIAKDCFKNLMMELKESTFSGTSHMEEVKHILKLHDQLDYTQSSFMNLFNYDYGHLAPHRDRCLVTIVYTHQRCAHIASSSESNHHQKKNLWCLQPGGDEKNAKSWTSIDDLVPPPTSTSTQQHQQHSVCLHIGEELRALSNFQLPAALHCVQVDPTTSCGSGSCSTVHHNRLSAALILSASEISAIVEDINSS